jgi:hypothetical protein
MKALTAAAFSGGPKTSLMRWRLEGPTPTLSVPPPDMQEV